MSESLLQASGLCTYYGTSQALFDVSLSIPKRGGVAILGRNGAGKTTLLKSLSGDLNPRRGSLHFDGMEITGRPTEQRVRQGLGHVPQEYAVFGGLTVRENLMVGAMADPRKDARIGEVVQLFPRLGERMSQQAVFSNPKMRLKGVEG